MPSSSTIVGGLSALNAQFAPLSDGAGLGIVFTVDPRNTWATAAWLVANRGIYVRCMGGGTITKIGIEVGVSSGNISVAVYRNTGTGRLARPTGSPVNSSGSVACPAIGYQEVSLAASTVVTTGDWLHLSCDNTTAAFGRCLAGVASSILDGFQCRQDSNHPGGTVGTLVTTSYTPVLIGVA